MASIKAPDSIPCRFIRSWVGRCAEPTSNGWCDKHEDQRCVSCGEKATKDCEFGIGGCICGAMICETCRHSREGGHVVAEVSQEMNRARRAEYKALLESRTSSTQRIGEDGVALNFSELEKGNMTGYAATSIYSLELKHGSMGYFPAIFVESRLIVVSTDLNLVVQSIWPILPTRQSKMNIASAWVNKELGIAFSVGGDSQDDKERSKPMKLITRTRFDELTSEEGPMFEWAPGLIGNDMSQDEFMKTIEAVAQECDIELSV